MLTPHLVFAKTEILSERVIQIKKIFPAPRGGGARLRHRVVCEWFAPE